MSRTETGQVPTSASAASQQVSHKPLPPAKPITRFDQGMPLPARTDEPPGSEPRLSVIVVAYAMPDQVDRTLHSLSLDYQRGVEQGDYEVILVENSSAANLGEARATRHRGNFRYYLREETAPTPIHAINFGVSVAESPTLAIMIDGARMLSPGALAWILAARALSEKPVVCIPGYHLGEELQQIAAKRGYNEAREAGLLESINWPEDGYRLFDISCSAGTSAGGFFKPIGESNCIALPKSMFDELGGFDEGFTRRGGGMVNLDFYKRALECPGSQLIILSGEGSFHQYHGGETTGRGDIDREQLIRENAEEYLRLRGERFSPPQQRAIFLGAIPDNALRYVRHSAGAVMRLNQLPDKVARKPRLSMVVVGYRMAEQLRRSLFTLSARYQRNVAEQDYEVIVVENASDQNLDQACLQELGSNFRYFLREETGTSPVHALNFGLQQALGEVVGVMIDGAHMLTPRVIEHALACSRAYPNHLVAVPVYHIGSEEQHESVRRGYDEAAQDTLLESVDWRADGYELLRISCWCSANAKGYMQPMSESNCYFAPRANLEKIGFADTRFTHEGGGALNLHMFRALGLLPGSSYIILAGEASFHQYHSGVTSNKTREDVTEKFTEQLRSIWHGQYKALAREPIFYGNISPQAQAPLRNASRLGERRFHIRTHLKGEQWPDKPVDSLDDLPFLGKD